jgi:hypothetical protein
MGAGGTLRRLTTVDLGSIGEAEWVWEKSTMSADFIRATHISRTIDGRINQLSCSFDHLTLDQLTNNHSIIVR